MKAAIELGLQALDLELEQVEIEVIQTERRGLFGIKGKEAVVKLTREQVVEPDVPNPTIIGIDPITNKRIDHMALEDFLEHIDQDLTESPSEEVDHSRITKEMDNQDHQSLLTGKAWVKDGVIFVKDSPNHQPSVKLGSGIKLRKNAEYVTQSFQFISEKDELAIEVINESHPTDWQIKCSKDNMEATLHISPGYFLARKVKDTAPTQQIILEATEERKLNQTLTYDEINRSLSKLGITTGIDEAEISKALETQTENTFVIARGISPGDGIDGSVEVLVETKVKDSLKESQNNSNIDYRERKRIPTVEKGEIIAMLHRPIPGKVGITIFGQPVEPRKVRDIQLSTQKGTILLDDRIIASENGRPYIEKRGHYVKTKVLPQMVHQGNVDLDSGNIQFQGDVHVVGEVAEGMTIQSGGEVLINQSVNGATIRALKSVHIKGSVNGSRIYAGGEINAEIQRQLSILHQTLLQMNTMLAQIMSSNIYQTSSHSETGVGPLITLIKEKRFKDLTKEVRHFIQLVDQQKRFLVDEEWQLVCQQLNYTFLKLPPKHMTIKHFDKLINQVGVLNDISQMNSDQEIEIEVANSLNSQLISSGDVLITERSCINTTIQAEGLVRITGIMRGGKVFAGKGADINEVGGKLGARTFITVPADQKVRIGKAMEGTTIKLGHKQYTFEKDISGIYARLNKNDEIILQ